MTNRQLTLTTLDDLLAVCRLEADAALPAWASTGGFFCITRTAEELSVVCSEAIVPDGVQCERGWRCLRVAGNIDFSMVGVLSSLAVPLAEAGVGVFAISTFDTDYLMLKEKDRAKALTALRQAGHRVE
jgi:hypothetical protein